MLYHHSSQEYNVAASEAAKQARVKMEEIIHKNTQSAIQVIEQVNSQIILDRLAPTNKLRFEAHDDHELDIIIDSLNEKYSIHDHALYQAAAKVAVPSSNQFVNFMRTHGKDGVELLAHNLTKLYSKDEDRHSLIRTVGGEMRGLLSDRFRRIDSRPLLEKFIEACQAIGARPIKGYAQDTKVILRAVLPIIFEPIDNEVMIFGIEWRNSDFGDGTHTVKLWNMRLWCTNTAILDSVLRQIHLGKRLDSGINFSQKTYELDTKATSSALFDVVTQCLSPDRIHAYLEGIKLCHEEKIDSRQVDEFLKKKFTKDEMNKVLTAFNSAEIEKMPAGQSKWRLANAISWVAQEQTSVDKQLYFNEVAGDLIPRTSKVTETVIEPVEVM